MAKKNNTLTEHAQQLHRALALANFGASTSESSTKREKSQVQKIIDKGNEKRLVTMSALLGCDTREPDPQKTTAVAYGAHLIKGEQTLGLLDEANATSQASALVDAHEAMESFLKAIAATYMYQYRGQIPVNQKDRRMMQRRFGNRSAAENTPIYFGQVVQVIASRNCDSLFKMLFKRVNGLAERVENGHYGNYHEIHKSVEFIRHAKTHSNGRFDSDDLAKLPKHTRQIVESCIQRSVIHSDDRILPTHKVAHHLLAREADFGQILYDALSNDMNMKIDYQPS